MVSVDKRLNFLYFGWILLVVLVAWVFVYWVERPSITGRFAAFPLTEDQLQDPSLVLYLTFDDPDDPWKDYSTYNHVFTANGEVNWVDQDYCKWYGCANFTYDVNGNDYLSSSAEWSGMDGIALAWWVYHTEKPAGSPSQFYFQIGDETNGTLKTMQDGGYGPSPYFYAENGIVDASAGSSKVPQENSWYFYFVQYNPAEGILYVWQNDQLVLNSTQNYGSLNYSIGDAIKVGMGRYGIDLHGYLDEFVVWNRSNFTSQEVLNFYNSQRLGTPPALDLYVKEIKYEIPYDWDVDGNPLITGGVMPITIVIANAGIQNSGYFQYELELEETPVCSGNINVPAGENQTIICNWNTEEGFQKGSVTLNINDDVLENNIQRIYIPFLDRPYYHYSEDEWNDYINFCQSQPDGTVAREACDWLSHFGCSEFQETWTGDSVDPYGPKALECAMGCAYNEWELAKTMCTNTFGHIEGWATRDIESYSGVQQIHYLNFVGMTLDLVQSRVTKEEWERYSQLYYEIAQHVTNHPNTRPDNDDETIISGGNGWGFGSGMGGFNYNMIGAYKENPTLIQQREQSYWGNNIPDLWMNREDSFLRARKNDSYSFYQEGVGYKYYAEALNLMTNILFRHKYNLIDIEDYDNEFCAMANENIMNILDFNHNGRDLRNDKDSVVRHISRGDGNSYDTPQGLVTWDVLLFYGLTCSNINTKSNMLWLRDKIQEITPSHTYFAAITYKPLLDQATPTSPENNFPKFVYDNANDIFYLRTNYTYEKDTVLLIDGGEERGSGHSQAQGYFLYINGIPFFDYEQTPYNDDVRSDPWKNGISFVNAPQTEAGQSGKYNSVCGDAGYNQYYGMSTCEEAHYPEDYPEWRRFPLEYGGDIEDYLGTADGKVGGAYLWRPYQNAEPVEEYFIKFNNLIAKRTKVNRDEEGDIYHNFININNEIAETRTGTKFTLSAEGTDVTTDIIWSDQTFTLGGGNSGVQVCYCKTSCENNCGGNSNYRRMYYKTTAKEADFILYHTWDDPNQVMQAGSGDKGLVQGSNVIIFDTNNDGITEYNGWETDGWALAYNEDEFAAFNATYIKYNNIELIQSDTALSIHIKANQNKITLTANTMERNIYTDKPKTARVTIDAYNLENNSNFNIIKDQTEIESTEEGTKVTFDIISGQNSDLYEITGAGTYTNNIPSYSNFDGITTDFNSIPDLQNAENITLEISQYGRIFFPGTTNVTYLDFDHYVSISQGTATIVNLKPLNKTATIYLYNLNYEEPRILRDGIQCPSEICEIVYYTNGTIEFNVAHFTTYSVEETPNEEEDEEEEEETSSESSSGGGGGGGGGSAPIPKTEITGNIVAETPAECIEEWECGEWSECQNNIQIRTCTDKNSCNKNKPEEVRECKTNIITETGNAITGFLSAAVDEVTMKDKDNPTRIFIAATLILLTAWIYFTYSYYKKK